MIAFIMEWEYSDTDFMMVRVNEPWEAWALCWWNQRFQSATPTVAAVIGGDPLYIDPDEDKHCPPVREALNTKTHWWHRQHGELENFIADAKESGFEFKETWTPGYTKVSKPRCDAEVHSHRDGNWRDIALKWSLQRCREELELKKRPIPWEGIK